jgi:hypothetical protein
MALIEVIYDIHRTTVRFERPVPAAFAEARELALLTRNENDEQVFFSIPVQQLGAEMGHRFLTVTFAEKVIALALTCYGQAQIGFVLDGVFQHGEVVRFSPEVLRDGLDLLKLNTRHVRLPEKPARVAVFTQAYNEGEMLAYWQQHYARQVGYENLYVLDNTSTDGSCAQLDPRVSVVHMPKTPVEHDHFAQAQGYFQRFLLLKYDWVVKVDTDELLVSEEGLVKLLARTPPGTYLPQTAVEVVHDAAQEPRFDFQASVGSQRRHFVRGTHLLLRPIVSSVPITWTSGNHLCHEPSAPLPGLITAHLKYFDLDFLLSKNKKWSQMTQTLHESRTCKQITELAKLDLQEVVDLSRREIAERMADEAVHLPAWFEAGV